jgi:hypothetical protein
MQSVTGLVNPVAAIVVSEESKDYRSEMEWLGGLLRNAGSPTFVVPPEQLKFRDGAVYLDNNCEHRGVDVIYRFFELFDMANVPGAEAMMTLEASGRVVVTPPLRPQLEEKLWFAVLHHRDLEGEWIRTLGQDRFQRLLGLFPRTRVLDPEADPDSAEPWAWLKLLTKSQRRLVIKPSGFSAQAWGSRGVVVGHDLSSADWTCAVDQALAGFETCPSLLQDFHTGSHVDVRYFKEGRLQRMEGRVRLTPYYFVVNGQAILSSILATVCELDKKKIHGMRDAMMAPCAVRNGASGSLRSFMPRLPAQSS